MIKKRRGFYACTRSVYLSGETGLRRRYRCLSFRFFFDDGELQPRERHQGLLSDPLGYPGPRDLPDGDSEGTSLYRETGDIYPVAEVLGHKDVNTTRKHYAAMGEDRRRQAASAVHLRRD